MSDAPAGWYPHPDQDGQEAYWDGSVWTGPSRPASVASLAATATATATPAAHPARPRAAWLAMTLVPMLVVAAVGLGLILGGSSDPETTLSSALSATLAQHTAHVTLSGSMRIEGVIAPIGGSGADDFAHHAGTLDITVSLLGQEVREKAVDAGRSIYLNLGPDVGAVLPGKSWVSMDFSQVGAKGGSSQLGSGGVDTSDAGAALHVLEQGGNTVTSLGSSTIRGVTVQGYAVTVDPATLRREVHDPHLPQWLRQAASSVSAEKVGYQAFVGPTGTVSRLTTNLSEQANGESVRETISTDFSDFGSPVHVVVPAPHQVVSYPDFLRAARALQSGTVS